MAYTPHNWSNNESVTASDLNNIEMGIADSLQASHDAVETASEAFAAADSNGEDIASLRDEIDALREALNTLAG